MGEREALGQKLAKLKSGKVIAIDGDIPAQQKTPNGPHVFFGRAE